MNVPTISMPRGVAREKMRACRTNLHRQAEHEFDQLLRGYQALEKGQKMLNVADVFRTCGLDDLGRPKLAICRADRPEVRLDWNSGQTDFLMRGEWGWGRRGRLATSLNLTFHHVQRSSRWHEWYAPVPMIPPDVIPKRGQRKQWHILWEVTEWSSKSKQAPPPHDPLLLKHLGGQLYVILAEWDLTPLERAVMAGAFLRT